MTTLPAPSEPLPYVESQLNYLLYEGKRPVSYAYPPPEGVPQYGGKPSPQRVRIRNARLLPELKIYDSRSDVPARLTAHTAFDDPETPPGAPPRRSIELRTLVFWPEAQAPSGSGAPEART